MVSVCLETTGLYRLAVALALHRHRRTQVMVVNPHAMIKYAQRHDQDFEGEKFYRITAQSP